MGEPLRYKREHGERAKYQHEACRCQACTDANRDYIRRWRYRNTPKL